LVPWLLIAVIAGIGLWVIKTRQSERSIQAA
jgi:hypothetical protein